MLLTSLPIAAVPRVRLAPDVARNDAAEIVDLSRACGTVLDPWQCDALQAACGVRPDGLWAAKTVGVNVSRQNGKSWILVARALAGALLFDEKVIICSAHEQKTSRTLFLGLVSYFENYNDLRKRVKSIGRALGREEIVLKDGTRLFFPARTRSTLRGWSIDCYLADEAQLVTDQQWESVKPAMSARPNSTAWLLGTAPQLYTDAEVFGRLRAAAHAGTDTSMAWIEYGAEPGSDLDDRVQWAAANPGRVEIDAIESERRELSPEGFLRERLNVWPTDRGQRVFNMDTWNGLVGEGPVDGTPPSALAVDASPDRVLSIAAAWLVEPKDAGQELFIQWRSNCHVELVAHECVADPLLALEWVVERAGRRSPVVIDGASPAAAMIPHLQARKVKVITTSAQAMAKACGGFLDDVVQARISRTGQPPLDAAVEGCRKRPIGEAGAFGWDRRDGSVVVSPLVAVTLAHFGAVSAGRRRSGRATFAGGY